MYVSLYSEWMMQSGMLSMGSGNIEEFVEVWAKNIDQAFIKIRNIVQEYPFIAMVRILSIVR